MDVLIYLIYVLKIIDYSFLIASLYLTERLFSELYMKNVYAEEKDPPNIMQFPFLFLSIHAGFTLFLFIILLLLMTVFKTSDNTFSINWYTINTYFFDFILTIFLLSLVCIIVGVVIQKKKYFRYQTEGLRAIRAYKDMTQYFGLIIFMLPYFLYF